MSLENFRTAAKCGGEKVDVITIHRQVCTNTFGQSPCTATGEPCFNTYESCRDRCNFTCTNSTDQHVSRKYNGAPISGQSYIPDVENVSYRPGRVDMCKPMASTAVLSVTLQDSPGCDFQDDPYIDQRERVGPYAPGTRLAKYIERNNLEGRRVDYANGYCGSVYDADYFGNTFLLDSIPGPSENCQYTLSAKDPLSLFIASKAQFPERQELELRSFSFGPFSQNIVLSPSDFPADIDVICIGNEAIRVQFSRIIQIAGQDEHLYDVLEHAFCGSELSQETFTRGEPVTVAHYWPEGTPAAKALFDLFFQNGNGLPTEDEQCDCGPFDRCLLDRDSFDQMIAECGASATIPETVICEPEDVADLVEELAPFLFNVYQDDCDGKVKISQIRPPACDDVFEEYSECAGNLIIQDSLRIKPRRELRATDIQLHSFPRDCTEGASRSNLSRTIVNPSKSGLGDACDNPAWKSPRSKEIESRFFNDTNISQARIAANRMAYLFRDAPIEVTFDVHDSHIKSGKTDYIIVRHDKIQNQHGRDPNTLFFVNSIQPDGENCWTITATSTPFTSDQKWVTNLDCDGPCSFISDPCEEGCADNSDAWLIW